MNNEPDEHTTTFFKILNGATANNRTIKNFGANKVSISQSNPDSKVFVEINGETITTAEIINGEVYLPMENLSILINEIESNQNQTQNQKSVELTEAWVAQIMEKQ